jgi:GAF domain-containing protein
MTTPDDDPSGEQPERSSADALGAYFMGDITIADALSKVCDAAMAAVPAAAMAGISMTVDARPGTYVFTHPDVQTIDQPQYDTGDGPCVDAFATGQTVIIASTLDDGPYPEFRHVAAEHGLLSVVSLPMNTGAQVVGALNLYATTADAFDPASIGRLDGFATNAAYLLLNHQAYWDARSLSENLNEAMSSRAQIEQAKGIILGATGCDADEAFHRLRAQSQAENVKLRDIAAELVRRSRRRH